MPVGQVVKVRIFGIEETVRSLNRGVRAINDQSDPLNLIVDDILDAIHGNFTSQGRRGGGSWKMLDKDTIKRKRSAVILFQSGRLMDSVTTRGSGDSKIKVNKHSLRMSTSVPYAATHQYGRGKIPARPFIKFTQGDRKTWANRLQDHLIEAMRGV